MKHWRLFSVFVLAIVALAVMAACIPAAPTVIDSQAVGAQEEFKTIRVKGLSDLRGLMTVGGNATFAGDLSVVGDITAASIVTDGNATLTSLSTTGNITASGTLSVAGQSTFNDSIYANAYVRASDGTVYVFDAFRVRQATALDGNAVVSGNLNVSGTISKGGVAFTGPIHYGIESTYTSGASISHGFATTPTMCVILPVRDVTSTVTITTTGFSSNMATIAIPLRWMCGL